MTDENKYEELMQQVLHDEEFMKRFGEDIAEVAFEYWRDGSVIMSNEHFITEIVDGEVATITPVRGIE